MVSDYKRTTRREGVSLVGPRRFEPVDGEAVEGRQGGPEGGTGEEEQKSVLTKMVVVTTHSETNPFPRRSLTPSPPVPPRLSRER